MRLHREKDFLERLEDVDGVVDFYDFFECGGHKFLVEEYIEGSTVNSELVRRNPLIAADATREDRIAYRDWALDIMHQVESAVRAFHARGIVFGDLHPNNIMLTAEGRVRFIDFEMAYDVNEFDVAPAGAPGFMADDGRSGIPADLYSLGCMKLGLFLPLTVLLPLDPSKLGSMVSWIQEWFELPDEYAESIARDIALPEKRELSSRLALATRSLRDRWPTREAEGLERIARSVAAGIDDALDLSRADRVYPGDIAQFTEGGFGIATGASGVLLTHPEAAQRDNVLDWIEEAATHLTQPALGFYDGLAGAAWTLHHFGRAEAAAALLERLQTVPLSSLTSDLYSGLAGIGTMLLELPTTSPPRCRSFASASAWR